MLFTVTLRSCLGNDVRHLADRTGNFKSQGGETSRGDRETRPRSSRRSVQEDRRRGSKVIIAALHALADIQTGLDTIDTSQKPRFPNLPGHSRAVPGSGIYRSTTLRPSEIVLYPANERAVFSERGPEMGIGPNVAHICVFRSALAAPASCLGFSGLARSAAALRCCAYRAPFFGRTRW